MDRGIPTEEVLEEMREAATPVQYLVGTPRGRLSQLEQHFLTKPWAKVRDAVQVKLVDRTANFTSWPAAVHAATRNRRCGGVG